MPYKNFVQNAIQIVITLDQDCEILGIDLLKIIHIHFYININIIYDWVYVYCHVFEYAEYI